MTATRLIAVLALLTATAPWSFGEDSDRTLSLAPYVGYQFKSDYGQAGVTITRVGADLGHTFQLTPKLHFDGSLKLEDSVYDFNDFRHQSPGVKTPIDNAVLLRLYPALLYSPNDRWVLRAGLMGQSSMQVGADLGDSLTYGAVGMAVYKVSPSLSIGGGIVYYTQLEDSSTFLPLVSIDWKISEKWHLGAQGTEGRVSYFVRPEVNYYLAGSYETRQYRLEDSAAYSAGVLNDNCIPVRLGVQWKPSDQLTVAGEIGAIAWQELTFNDRDGNRIVKDHVDPTVFLGLQFNYRF